MHDTLQHISEVCRTIWILVDVLVEFAFVIHAVGTVIILSSGSGTVFVIVRVGIQHLHRGGQSQVELSKSIWDEAQKRWLSCELKGQGLKDEVELGFYEPSLENAEVEEPSSLHAGQHRTESCLVCLEKLADLLDSAVQSLLFLRVHQSPSTFKLCLVLALHLF